MAFFKVDEATAAQRAADKAAALQLRDEQRAAAELQRNEEAFRKSPAGQARLSLERGNQIFQISLDLENIKALVIPMGNAHTTRQATDVSDVINSIVVEGWDFHTLSTTFVNEGEESRDKFMASGQYVAVRGRIVGTYVFTRSS